MIWMWNIPKGLCGKSLALSWACLRRVVEAIVNGHLLDPWGHVPEGYLLFNPLYAGCLFLCPSSGCHDCTAFLHRALPAMILCFITRPEKMEHRTKAQTLVKRWAKCMSPSRWFSQSCRKPRSTDAAKFQLINPGNAHWPAATMAVHQNKAIAFWETNTQQAWYFSESSTSLFSSLRTFDFRIEITSLVCT